MELPDERPLSGGSGEADGVGSSGADPNRPDPSLEQSKVDAVDASVVRAELLAARSEAQAQYAARQADFEAFVEGADLVNTDDEHDPEGATIAFERAQVIALRDDAARRIGLLDDALARLEAGTYGRCIGCGAPIPAARLAAIAGVETCVECAASGVG